MASRPPAKPAVIYVALLRGVNVGGNSMVSMKSLKESFERLGFSNVRTYINSGNVLFRSIEQDPRKLETTIDRMLARDYALKGKTVVRSHAEMRRLLQTIGDTCKPDPDARHNIVYLRHAIDDPRIVEGLALQPDIDHVVYCSGTLLWSVPISERTRSAMVKLPRLPIYQNMTVRNLNTTTKLVALMEEMEKAARS